MQQDRLTAVSEQIAAGMKRTRDTTIEALERRAQPMAASVFRALWNAQEGERLTRLEAIRGDTLARPMSRPPIEEADCRCGAVAFKDCPRDGSCRGGA
jgi:hypothetical protein